MFCGITLKHYAYFNMSRRTQLTTKYFFQIISQLSENFIFIYLGLALFTESALDFQPPLIIVTICAVCAARYAAVFPLSKAINWFNRYRARRRGVEVDDVLPYNYQAMLFWAGLRGAVGVALAALLTGENSYALRATVLVVVVLTVIIFGGTTARMLEILGIRTGVVEEIDSDDEFDIESFGGGLTAKRSGSAIGYNYHPRRNGNVALSNLDHDGGHANAHSARDRAFVSGHSSPHPDSRPRSLSRKASPRLVDEFERSNLLGGRNEDSDLGSDIDTSDLPPPAPRRSPRPPPQNQGGSAGSSSSNNHATSESAFMTPSSEHTPSSPMTARGAIRQLFSAEDPAGLFRQLDEDFIKPTLLLQRDGSGRPGSGHGGGGHGNGSGAV